MFYSVILPTFGRPADVSAFLESLTRQSYTSFEVIIVDGSLDDILQPVIKSFSSKLKIKYFYERGLGASESRNKGCDNAKGDYLVFIDSDCILPSHYFAAIDDFIKSNRVDGFGGPDDAHHSFSSFQKAVNYAMTSFFTSGGIRGKKHHLGDFHLRGFNMGISRKAFDTVGGFSEMQVAEDLDISIRLLKAGFKTALISNAYVYHRRKSDFKKFFKQLYMHGKGRIDLYMRHRGALKPLHFLPALFIFYLIAGILSAFLAPRIFLVFAGSIVLYIILVFIDSLIQYKSIYTSFLSIIAALELLVAYGAGLLRNLVVRVILGRGTESMKSAELKE